MNNANSFDHKKQLADRGDRVRLPESGLYGYVNEISVDISGWSYFIKLDDGGYFWRHGDQLIFTGSSGVAA